MIKLHYQMSWDIVGGNNQLGQIDVASQKKEKSREKVYHASNDAGLKLGALGPPQLSASPFLKLLPSFLLERSHARLKLVLHN